jgi:aminoglycoside phosphotransferase (APT) family kinase protein
MSNTQPSRESLSQLVAEHIDADPSEVQLRPCPTGKHNQTYFVDVADQSLVLRVAPPDDPTQMLFYEYSMMRQEPNLHALLRERTDAPVPEILAFDAANDKITRDYLLMERMPRRCCTWTSGRRTFLPTTGAN